MTNSAKGKFSALGRLGDVNNQVAEENSKREAEEARKLEISVFPEQPAEEPWEALGTEVKTQTKRRVKAYAGMTGRKIKDVVDEALTQYLERMSAQP